MLALFYPPTDDPAGLVHSWTLEGHPELGSAFACLINDLAYLAIREGLDWGEFLALADDTYNDLSRNEESLLSETAS